jgi:hypothetical protein
MDHSAYPTQLNYSIFQGTPADAHLDLDLWIEAMAEAEEVP